MSLETSVDPLVGRRGACAKWLQRMLAAAFVLVIAGPAAAAGPFYVDGTFGSDANACTAPGLGACQTIQAAINKAPSGSTINVAAGIYNESAPGPLTINKTLTLLGVQNGVDARTRVGAESVIMDPQGTSISASGVVVNGFTVQDSTNQAFTGYGIWMNPGTSGTQIVNNIIQNNIVGIGLAASPSGSQVVIQHNVIRFNNLPGGASGTGIYTDQFVGGPIVRNVLIEENAFIGNDDAGIDVSNTDKLGGVFDMDVSTNSFDSNGRAVVLFNTHDSTFHDNTIPNTTFVGSAAIRLFDNNTNFKIRFDSADTGVGHAARISYLGLVGGPSSGVVINENNIGVAGSASFALDGLLVDLNAHDGTVNAECNWWGSSTGPMNASNPGGTGEEVVGDADFTPWLTGPLGIGVCLGGAPSVPGKVTGGGQIPGEDPLFSPLGELISLPALVPSLSNSNADATFGFVAKCCPESGNLEYNDHQAGVRIKAVSVETLKITSPGASCASGGKHATFTGNAHVIRSTGTTDEPYTVDVDDCGEPGTQDTFGIKTLSYSSGPSTLMGGNIKIH